VWEVCCANICTGKKGKVGKRAKAKPKKASDKSIKSSVLCSDGILGFEIYADTARAEKMVSSPRSFLIGEKCACQQLEVGATADSWGREILNRDLPAT
jgi:hypothetical protein